MNREMIQIISKGFDVLNPTAEDVLLSFAPTNTNCGGC
ncbi:hypothetical protein B4113_0032 [Geobacillus sp. B4113_201601]|nr:hypothetical protein B4113_0032 [Geobacillus sp. B4113_201601]